jgi:integral membrane protein
MFQFDAPTSRLRSLAFWEGVSYLALLFVAMPLKYLAGIPLAVRIAGTVHGALFVALFFSALHVYLTHGRKFRWGVEIAVASLIPFGTFILDGRLKREAQEARAKVQLPPGE